MFRDRPTSSRRFDHGLFMLRIRVAVNSHDWNLPSLHDIPTLVTIELKNTSMLHFCKGGEFCAQKKLRLTLNHNSRT